MNLLHKSHRLVIVDIDGLAVGIEVLALIVEDHIVVTVVVDIEGMGRHDDGEEEEGLTWASGIANGHRTDFTPSLPRPSPGLTRSALVMSDSLSPSLV